MNTQWLDLIQRYADGRADVEEVGELQKAMKADPELRARFVDYMNLDASLSAAASAREASIGTMKSLPKTPRPIWLQWRPLAWAALVPLAGLCVWFAAHPSGHSIAVEVEIMQLGNAGFAAPNVRLREHEKVKIATLVLRRGAAHLRLPSGVKLVMSGPAELRFVDAMHARVLHGKVTVDVGEHGKGFVLDTPVTRVVDLGTRFGVEAKADGRTDVMVLEGRVELFNPQQSQRAAALEQGEAVRVDASQTVVRIVNITGSLQPSEWSTQPPPPDCNIVSVSDDLDERGDIHFYRIVPHGLRPGAVVYTNRPYTWVPADGQDFPASLFNADVVQTFHGELKHAVAVVVARPVQLFVIMPKRGIPQAWLTENFTRTGEELLLDELRPGVPAHAHFEVWKCTVPGAGKVMLGPANRNSEGISLGMYGIAATAL